MDPIEKAIRNALEKGNADDPAFRERVYRSVEAALDRAIRANPQLTVERAIGRRKGLQAKIAEIEAEYRPAEEDGIAGGLDQALMDILSEAAAAPPAAGRAALPEWPSVDSAAPRADAAPPLQSPAAAPLRREPQLEPRRGIDAAETGGRREPSFGFPAPPQQPAAPAAGRHEPSVDLGIVPERTDRVESDLDGEALPPPLDAPDISAPVPPSPPETVAADRAARSRERRRPFAALFFGVALISLIAVGVLFAWRTGLFLSPEQRDTSVPNPPAELGSEDFDPAGEAPPALSDEPAAERDWITIFSPANAATASAPGDGRAETMQDDSGSFLRIRSGATGAPVSFAIGQGVLERLAGKTAVFSVAARAEEGQETEFSVECGLDKLGDCGRRRYEASYELGEFLFEIDLPDQRPGSGGSIAINPDISLQGKALDVYEIRVALQ